MVQGLPAIDWKKADNNAKLFAAVLALFPGTPDHKKIATAFGPNIPASAISYRLGVVRKEGAALGLTPGSGSFSASARINGIAKRDTPAAKNNLSKRKKRERGGRLSDDASNEPDIAMDNDSEEDSAVDTDDEKAPATSAPSVKRQKTIGGRVTKRVSPRKGKSTEYKKLDDPFITMDSAKDEDGNNVFGEPSSTESEDTYATDGSFKDIGKNATVSMEDAV